MAVFGLRMHPCCLETVVGMSVVRTTALKRLILVVILECFFFLKHGYLPKALFALEDGVSDGWLQLIAELQQETPVVVAVLNINSFPGL